MSSNTFHCSQGREFVVQIRMAQLQHAFRARQVAQLIGPQLRQPRAGGQVVDDHRLSRTRQHSLTPVCQVPQPAGAVDGRSDIARLATVRIAQLDIAGVQTDAQPDWREVGTLQGECTGHRIAGPVESDDEAVAFALVDRADSVMRADKITQGAVQPRDGGRGLLGPGLPKPGGAFDVGK